jgi:hypothetical protein
MTRIFAKFFRPATDLPDPIRLSLFSRNFRAFVRLTTLQNQQINKYILSRHTKIIMSTYSSLSTLTFCLATSEYGERHAGHRPLYSFLI